MTKKSKPEQDHYDQDETRGQERVKKLLGS